MKPQISIVVPVWNEREALDQLHAELTKVLTQLHHEYEIIFVDDGSTDGSTELCQGLVSKDPRVALVELRRHFGKSAALQAGFHAARGMYIVTLDADLQDDPKEIPRFIEQLENGFDLVCGWKAQRKDPLAKTLPSKLFNFVTAKASGLKLKDFNCGFKAYRREVIEGLDLYGELHRYIPVIVHSKGFRATELPVAHRPRPFGKSKYGWERFLRGPFDLFTVLFLSGFRKRPLHLFGPVGVLIGGSGLLIDAYLAVLWFGGEGIGDRPLLMLGTLMMIVGVQILIFGLLAEMITSATHRPSEADDLVRRVVRQGGELSRSRRVVWIPQ